MVTLRQLQEIVVPVERITRGRIIILLDSMLRLFIPVVRLHLLLLGATLQLTTLRDGGCDLRLDLYELIVHVKLQLSQRLLRIIGLLNHSVEIGPQQSKYTFQQIHENTSPVVIRFPGRPRGSLLQMSMDRGRGR